MNLNTISLRARKPLLHTAQSLPSERDRANKCGTKSGTYEHSFLVDRYLPSIYLLINAALSVCVFEATLIP
jgi:hypothetical protein